MRLSKIEEMKDEDKMEDSDSEDSGQEYDSDDLEEDLIEQNEQINQQNQISFGLPNVPIAG